MSADVFDVIDPRFRECIPGTVQLDKLATGTRWAEGPAWFGAGRYLVWSDIPNDRMMRWDETDGSVSVFRQPCNNTNGHTVDLQGRLISCEHRGRRITRTEPDGSITVLADTYEGGRLNSPNDVVVKSDGTIWFTDPSYGILTDYEGDKAEQEQGGCFVFRLDPESRDLSVVAVDLKKPNGLAFSADESKLYVVDTGASHDPDGPRHMRVFRVGGDGRSLAGGEVFAECTAGFFDGFRVDTDDRIWTSAFDGVHCYLPDGTLIGKIPVPEVVANACFGGRKKNRLFICGTTSLYAVYVNARGAAAP